MQIYVDDPYGFLFTLDPESGEVISGLMQLEHTVAAYTVNSAGMLMVDTMVYMVFEHHGSSREVPRDVE